MTHPQTQVNKKQKAIQLGLKLSPVHLARISSSRLDELALPLNTSYTMVWCHIKSLRDKEKKALEAIYSVVYQYGHQYTYATLKELMSASGLTKRTFQRSLATLNKLGLVKSTNFHRAPNIYQIPSICFMEKFARPLSKVLHSCRFFLQKNALSIMLISSVVALSVHGAQSEKLSTENTYALRNKHFQLSCEAAKEGMKMVRDMAQESLRSDVRDIQKALSLTLEGAVRLMAFSPTVLADAFKKVKREMATRLGTPNAVAKPAVYLLRIATDLSSDRSEALDLRTVNALQAEFECRGDAPFHEAGFSAGVCAQGFEQEFQSERASSFPQRGMTQSRSAAHRSPDYSGKQFKQVQIPPFDPRFPGRRGDPMPMNRLPWQKDPDEERAQAAREALSLELHTPSGVAAQRSTTPQFNQITKDTVDDMGEDVVEVYWSVEQLFQSFPQRAVLVGGCNPYERMLPEEVDIELAYSLRGEAWRKIERGYNEKLHTTSKEASVTVDRLPF